MGAAALRQTSASEAIIRRFLAISAAELAQRRTRFVLWVKSAAPSRTSVCQVAGGSAWLPSFGRIVVSGEIEAGISEREMHPCGCYCGARGLSLASQRTTCRKIYWHSVRADDQLNEPCFGWPRGFCFCSLCTRCLLASFSFFSLEACGLKESL